MIIKWWPRLRSKKNLEAADELQSVFLHFEKFGETLTPNLRALRLTMTMSDVLLSMGVAANSVVSKALDVTETYCEKPVHIDVNSNVLLVSQLRGIDKEPLTLMRPVTPRDINYMVVQRVQRLIYEISEGKYALDDAEKELESILAKPPAFPWWLTMMGNAGIAAGVSLMFTQSWQVIATTFGIGLIVDRLLALMVRRAIPTFFRQVLAAAFVTLAAAFVAFLGREGVTFFVGINPTLIVVGGIIMLLAGLVIVGAIQDAIDEYYVTATARLLKVVMLTSGIVVGILVGLYTARVLGIGINVSPDPLRLNDLHFMIIGAAVAAAAYAVSTHTHIRAVIWSGIVGASALGVSYLARDFEIGLIPAAGLAAIVVGLVAAVLSRFWRTPSSGVIAAGIIPLVPGLALYNGLMQLISYPAGDPDFFRGIGTLFTALGIALAIAAGASFGSMIGRPIHQKIARNRNQIPFKSFMRRQLGARAAAKK